MKTIHKLPGDFCYDFDGYTFCISKTFYINYVQLENCIDIRKTQYKEIFEIRKDHKMFIFFDREIVKYEYIK